MFMRPNRKSIGVFRKTDLRSRNRPPFVAGMIVGSLTLFIGFAILIAARTVVPEVTRAPGEITPTDDFQQIEAPEVGTVVSVNAREGDLVTGGQVLATLASTELSRQMLALTAELDALREQQRNHAFILDGLNSVSSDQLHAAGDTADLSYAMSTLIAFEAQQDSDRDTINRLSIEAKSQMSALSRLRARKAEKSALVLETESLLEKGLSTRAQFNASKDALSAIDDQIHALELNLSSTEKEIAKLRAKLIQDRLDLKEKHVEHKFELEKQLVLKETERRTLDQRAAALEIVAPTDGRIHSVGYPNKGEVIERGETLFELLPTGEALVAVLRLPTRDIGHISTGMTVKMRLETFDARSTQPLIGQIRSISPNRVFDRDLGEDFFRATVTLNEDGISFKMLEDRLSAGMALTAEVVTRERSMLAYILKPIERSFSSAFGER